MTGSIRKALAAVQSFLKSRSFAVAALTTVLAFTVYHATSLHVVQVREGDEVRTYYTMDDDPEQILERHGYNIMAYDAVEFTGFYNKVGEISIDRAFPVQVNCDGDVSVLMVTDGTVSDVLETADIALDNFDQVDQPLEQVVEEHDVINVTRQSWVPRIEEQELPYETVSVYSPEIAPGTQEVLQEGESGLVVDTFSQWVVDGELEEELYIGRDIVKEKVDSHVMVGFKSRPVSQLDFAWEFDEDGEPLHYTNVLRGEKSAGYSARPGAGTASGRPAMVGHVAVDPNVIPYGSKLFIQSADSDFVYGYAIAADTGTALMEGLIAVDLFYGSYAESAQNGIRNVDIFVLE